MHGAKVSHDPFRVWKVLGSFECFNYSTLDSELQIVHFCASTIVPLTLSDNMRKAKVLFGHMILSGLWKVLGSFDCFNYSTLDPE